MTFREALFLWLESNKVKPKIQTYCKYLQLIDTQIKFDELFADLDEELPNPDDEIDTIILNDANGNEVEYEFMDLIYYEDGEYMVLLPVEDCEEAGKVVVFKLEDDDDEDEISYVSVDDENVLSAVFNVFKENFQDEFNFAD